jgi:SAM-dependent methyltransferase
VFVLRLLPFLVGAGLIGNGVRLRGRLRRLDTAPASGRPADPEHEFLVADGVRVSEAARRAASNFASREHLTVLDLVPAGLTVERTLDVARMVDTRTYRADRMARGRGAFQALLVHRSVLERAGIAARDGIDRIELVEITAKLKRYAPVTTDLAVVEGVTPASDDAFRRLRVQRAAYRFEPYRTYLPNVRDTLSFVGVLATFPYGLTVSVLYWLQPFFVCAGRVPIAPRDLYRSPLKRILAGVDFVVGSARDRRRRAQAAPPAPATGLAASSAKERKAAEAGARRAQYQAEIRAGVENYLETARATCPWCGSSALAVRLQNAPDALLRKPGRFRYDRCAGCDHIFQNPRLSIPGLEFYYRDCYDGLNAALAEEVLGAAVPAHRERAAMMRPYATPRAWLDVGGGHGHFANVARDTWPDTAFDALDSSDGIEEAVRRRWVDRGYRGMFPELGGQLDGRYDVISMFHYLEHTREPLLELDTAAKALVAGGHLFIELPNAHSPSASLFRSYWIGWFTPQHQHFIPADNLLAALRQRGLTPVRVQFGKAHQGGGLSMALFFMLTKIAPDPTLPWLPHPPNALSRVRRVLGITVVAPLFVLASLFDSLSRPYFTSGRRATAYRVIARKDG